MKVNLKKLSMEQITDVLHGRASRALKNANPIISDFRVGAAGLARGMGGGLRIVAGWNQEFKNNDSIHAEESMVADLWKGEQLTRIIILGENKMSLAPCGNCREVLTTRSAEDAEVLVSKETGESNWMLVNDLLPNAYDFREASSFLTLDHQALALFDKAVSMLNARPYNPYTGELRAAAVWTRKGSIFAASNREDAAYHHDHAVENVLVLADAEREREIYMVLYLHDQEDISEPLFPCGRCRQKLYESLQVSGVDFKVVSATTLGDLWYTTVSKLFPHAFGPKDLGIDVSRYLALVHKK